MSLEIELHFLRKDVKKSSKEHQRAIRSFLAFFHFNWSIIEKRRLQHDEYIQYNKHD